MSFRVKGEYQYERRKPRWGLLGGGDDDENENDTGGDAAVAVADEANAEQGDVDAKHNTATDDEEEDLPPPPAGDPEEEDHFSDEDQKRKHLAESKRYEFDSSEEEDLEAQSGDEDDDDDDYDEVDERTALNRRKRRRRGDTGVGHLQDMHQNMSYYEVWKNKVSWPPAYYVSDSPIFKPYTNYRGMYTLVGLRLTFGVYLLVVMLWGLGSESGSISTFLAKMTGWAYFMAMGYFFLSAYFTWTDQGAYETEHSTLRKFTIFLFEAAWSWAPVVTVLYWSSVNGTPYMVDTKQSYILAVHTHGGSMILLVLDMIWNKCEFAAARMGLVVLAAFAYIFTNGAYQIVLNYKQNFKIHSGYTAMVWLMSIFGMIIFYYVGYAIVVIKYKLRKPKKSNFTISSSNIDSAFD